MFQRGSTTVGAPNRRALRVALANGLGDQNGLSLAEYSVLLVLLLIASMLLWRGLGDAMVCKLLDGGDQVVGALGEDGRATRSDRCALAGSNDRNTRADARPQSAVRMQPAPSIEKRPGEAASAPRAAATPAPAPPARGPPTPDVQQTSPALERGPDPGSTQVQSFTRLRAESWTESPLLQRQLQNQHAAFQVLAEGSGAYVYDDYSVLITAMPNDVTPEAFLDEMAADLNATVKDESFDGINVFERRTTGPPKLGEVIDIDIVGPENGSVALVEKTPTYFVFQTLRSDKTGTHPEYGAREFGFQREAGGVRFYTRGVSRPKNAIFGMAGSIPQRRGWTRLVTGISNRINADGGTSDPESIAIHKEGKNQ